MATTVRQMLVGKTALHSVTPDTLVFDALTLMAREDVGALVVLAGGELAGIFSERDYARKIILLGRTSKDTTVREVMTPHVICVDPRWTADQCMALMTERRVRHLPVLENGRLAGIVSIGDVVRAVLEEQRDTIHTLEHYITSGA
jgi:CBS domain-containing protein